MKTMVNRGIPVSLSLEQTLDNQNIRLKVTKDKKRMVYIAALAICIAAAISFIARILVNLINLFSNISFHGDFSFAYQSPATNHLGAWVIVIPALGGVVVGLMALYGSKAIRGHGIPEAMEQILTNQSRIRPSITYLKPLSAAVSIGTGGPFGAEGPIIATGGALGSTLGQILKISPYERKILLAAGATAGMSAIFGSPIAAIFLAIELLLFEFSPKSIIPVALACITGAAGHHLFFEAGPVFPMPFVNAPTNSSLAAYSAVGIAIGLIAAAVTKIVYWVEDGFENLPVHWMWGPAIGGLAVGIIGYFAPRTLGVGYSNITDLLSGTMAIQVVLALCILKFLSWAIALGSGTSGGTLAPLLTIGAAAGALLGIWMGKVFPEAGISVPMAAIVGMSAMFAGASRALLTSIVFAIETTGQSNALLPLLAACVASYFISYLVMENTIMTEKIARRGVKTPHSYEPDVLYRLVVKQVASENGFVIDSENRIEEVREWLEVEKEYSHNYFIVADADGNFKGVVSSSNLFSKHHDSTQPVASLIKRMRVSVSENESLRDAVDKMAKENVDVLPVVSMESNKVIGILSYKDILTAYRHRVDEHETRSKHISLKRQALKVLSHGKNRILVLKDQKKTSL
jgi:CIC family chloride channel protein